jgi:glycine/D-amino acid oxidase-like deaminating enzyme
MAIRCDTIVVGGGLLGMAVAYGLRLLGMSVAVIDGGDVAHRASRGTFGLVWAQSKGRGMPEYARWTRDAIQLWPAFAQDLLGRTGIEVNYSRCGGYMFAFTDDELDRRKEDYGEICDSIGLAAPDFEVIDRKAVSEAFPGIGEAVRGATYCPIDGDCDPLALLRALHRVFIDAGGRHFPGHILARIDDEGPRPKVETNRQTFEADRIVLCAGIGNRELAKDLGCALPLKPLRGQILVSERVKPVIPHLTHIIRQTREGSIMIGDSHENVDFDDGTTATAMCDIASNATKTFPFLRDLRIVRSWGCLRPMPLDGFPIYDRVPGHPNVIVLNTHSGVTLAAAHAGPLAEQISNGTLGTTERCFSMDRFDVQAA